MNYRVIVLITIISIYTFISGCASTNEIDKNIEARDLYDSYIKLQRAGWPILNAALPLCNEQKYRSPGFNAINKYDFPERLQSKAVSILDMSDVLKVVHVNDGSPAMAAGLIKDDEIIAINDKDAPTGNNANKEFIKLLVDESNNNVLNLKINRSGIEEVITINPIDICDIHYFITLEYDKSIFAEGNHIKINNELIKYAKSDDELAYFIGHHLAHTTLNHFDIEEFEGSFGHILGRAVIETAFLAALMAISGSPGHSTSTYITTDQSTYSQEDELMADYISLYMVARAEREIIYAPSFWKRISESSSVIIRDFSITHPFTEERLLAMEETIKEIEDKKDMGKELLPENENINQDSQLNPVKISM